MSTPNLTSADFGSGTKFAAIQSQITPSALDYINRSERLKELIRAYEGDDNAENVIVDSAKARAATYTVPVIANDGTTERGTATFGTETINTLHRLIETLSHELGHYAVENPGQIIANARAAAVAAVRTAAATGDSEARRGAANDYDAACHLTEGYARLATAKVIDEIIVNGALASSDGSWLLDEDSAYKEYKALQSVAAETSWTAAEMERAIAFSLGGDRERLARRRGNAVRMGALRQVDGKLDGATMARRRVEDGGGLARVQAIELVCNRVRHAARWRTGRRGRWNRQPNADSINSGCRIDGAGRAS